MPLYSEKNIIDEQMRLRLQNLRMKPSHAAWKRFEQSLPSNGLATPGKDYRKLLGVLFISAIVGAGSLVQQIHQPVMMKPAVLASKSNLSNERIGKSHQVAASSDGAHKANLEKYPSAQPAISFSAIELKSANHTSQQSTTSEQPASAVITDHQVASGNLTIADISSSQKLNTDLAFLPNQKTAEDETRLHSRDAGMDHQLQKFVKTDFTGWYVGFGNVLNNTWLLSKSILQDNNLNLIPTFGLAFDAHIGYQFLSRWGMEAGWIIHSQQGQKYSITNSLARSFSATPEVNELSLEYMQFPVTVHYRIPVFSGSFNQPMKIDVYGGMQVDRIVNVEETFSGITSDEVPSVKPLNLSGVLGIDYDLMLPKKPIFFAFGARISMGGSVFSKEQDQNLFVNPHNVLIGLHAAINFTPSKGK
jgi:Outer membrane protein beta-barrel domain